MWVADERGVRGVVAACIQHGFKFAAWTMEVIDGSKMGGWRVGHPLQLIVYESIVSGYQSAVSYSESYGH
jgi:hypothetical protein